MSYVLLLRDSNEWKVPERYGRWRGLTYLVTAKMMSFRGALSWLKDIQDMGIIFETDCLQLLESMPNPILHDQLCELLIQDYKSLLENLPLAPWCMYVVAYELVRFSLSNFIGGGREFLLSSFSLYVLTLNSIAAINHLISFIKKKTTNQRDYSKFYWKNLNI